VQSTDVGTLVIHGSTKSTNDGFEVVASGKDIWDTSDQFHFAYQKQTGDFDVVVRVESVTATHLYSRAGLMARESLSPGSRHVFFLVFPDNRPRHKNTSAYELQYRARKDSESAAIYPPHKSGFPAFPVAFPHAWLRLKRGGNKFTCFVSADGKSWKEYGSYSLDLPETLLLGLAATSEIETASTTAIFKDLNLVGK
jgi:regulation of enolase protein 1 (concanavalin A-like superfamily)